MECGKTGKFLCSDWLGADSKPDMITLGKSITGGVYPASYILGSNDVMTLVKPYQVGSTFAMAPPANAATMAALRVYDEPGLIERAFAIESKWKTTVATWNHDFIKYTTCRGADMRIIVKADAHKVTARRIARLAFQKGVLIYPQGTHLRVGVALTITDAELDRGLRILTEVMSEIESYGEIPGSLHAVDGDVLGF
jgi:ornithine--oxo-acid transaminase